MMTARKRQNTMEAPSAVARKRSSKRSKPEPQPETKARKRSKPEPQPETKARKRSRKPDPQPETKARPQVLGYSASAMAKWMGKQGWTTEQAMAAFAKLCTGEVAASTIRTGMSDGKNPKYNGGTAAVTKEDARKLAAAAKAKA